VSDESKVKQRQLATNKGNVMGKYIFLTLPAYGHVNLTLAIAQELVKRGQEVVYYLPEDFRETVQATGAVLHTYEPHVQKQIVTTILPPIWAEKSRLILPQILERIRADEADVIVYDLMCLWARFVVQILKMPAISFFISHAVNEHFNPFLMRPQPPDGRFPQIRDTNRKVHAAIAEICATYQLPPIDLPNGIFTHAEALNIAFSTRAFQPAGETFDERYLFVGPSISPRREHTDFPFDKLDPACPLLYISLGTVANNVSAFFQQCIAAFGESKYQVVLSRGEHIDPTALGTIPDNFLISPYVPQLDILARAHVFITHAGMNSTMESLYYGVPMIAIPQQSEQSVTAQRLAELGLGIVLGKEVVNVTMLQDAVEQVANDLAMRERVQQMKQTTREAGGYIRATDAIMRFKEVQRQAL
jgi:MGT family glycosyltransferase